jgi:dinuclear metal center YbgI/SA1388 family protein
MLLKEFDALIRSWLPFDLVEKVDVALNGLQVGRTNPTLKRITFTVDASVESFERAAGQKADLLFVHHGLFFGKVKPVTGNLLRRISFLVEHDLALYAVHLPLDMAAELGNNAGIAQKLKLGSLEPFGAYHGVPIGCKGVLPEPRRFREVVETIAGSAATPHSFLSFGPETISTVGIVSGGAAEVALEAIAEGLDLYITGERSHEIYHECQEAGLNVLFAGHYNSEVYGVEAVRKRISAETDVETFFIDVPTGY